MSDKPSLIQRFNKNRDRNAIIICVVIAIAFWLTNALSESYTHDFEFSLDYELQNNVSFASPPLEQIEARLSGQGWELLKASLPRSFRQVKIQVLRPEITRSDLIAAVYQHLSEYEIVVREVNVDVMTLDINMLISRSIEIQYDAIASCADGFVFKDSLHLEPSHVNVSGPSSLLERLEPIRIDIVELELLSEDLNQVVDIVLPQEQYIIVEPKQVNLIATIEKEIQVSSMMPINFIGDTAGIDFAPLATNVSYSVGESKIDTDELNEIQVACQISASDTILKQATIKLTHIPSFAKKIALSPDVVSLSVRSQ